MSLVRWSSITCRNETAIIACKYAAASDDSCGGGLGTRLTRHLQTMHVRHIHTYTLYGLALGHAPFFNIILILFIRK